MDHFEISAEIFRFVDTEIELLRLGMNLHENRQTTVNKMGIVAN